MKNEEMRRLLREVEMAGQCSHPIRLRGETVNIATGEVEPASFKVACKDRREAVCPACSRRYGTDAWIIAATGLNGGKGVDQSVVDRPKVFMTVTAPGFGSVHTVARDGGCVRAAREGVCAHGHSARCGIRHEVGESLLGQPLCSDCFDYEGAVLWNANASRLWALTMQNVRRNLATRLGVPRQQLHQYAKVHYFKVAEMQRRGLVHFHALVRLDVEDISDGPDETSLIGALRHAITGTSFQESFGTFQWGRVVDIQTLGRFAQDARMVATYLAKYVTKTSGDALELARRFDSRRDISVRVRNPHLRKMALSAWELDYLSGSEELRLKEHAHTLGYSGHLITKSREFSTTFGALRQARSDFNASLRMGEPVTGTFHYEGRGYDDPKATDLAVALTNLERGLRVERAEREGRAAPDVRSRGYEH